MGREVRTTLSLISTAISHCGFPRPSRQGRYPRSTPSTDNYDAGECASAQPSEDSVLPVVRIHYVDMKIAPPSISGGTACCCVHVPSEMPVVEIFRCQDSLANVLPAAFLKERRMCRPEVTIEVLKDEVKEPHDV